MLFITSPAKRLDWTSNWPTEIAQQPLFLDQAEQIIESLKKYSKKQLKKILHASEPIVDLNYERYHSWEKKHDFKNSKAAIFAYNGDIFREIKVKTYTKANLEYINKHLRVLSGLYGIVRPYDLIQPYRLEMNAEFKIGKFNDLYSFWKKDATQALNDDLEKFNYKYLINTASEEYYNAIDFSKIVKPIININFRQEKKGKLENVGILSKKARGMVADFATKNNIEELSELKKFDYNGYQLYDEDENNLYFRRKV